MISLAALVPLILILMTITGAVYPAIDLTAGERERGTLEILVAAPVPRLGLLFAKYVSVFSVAVLTAVVNLVSMVLTLVFSGLSEVLFAGGGLTPLLVLQLLGLLLLFAAFFSAVLLSLTSCARSFKEAQAYLIPLMLASLGPGLIGMIPGLSLEGPLAVVPLVNIVLLARDLVQGGADPAWALVVVVTTLAYAAGAVAVAARIFGAEGMLYNEQSGWADLLRRPTEPQPVATLSGALWCLVLMIPTHFTLQWLVRLVSPSLPTAWAYVAIGIVGVILFGLLPLLSAFMGRVRLASGFGLLPARPAAVLGGLMMGCTLWPLILQLLMVLLRDRSEQLKALLEPQLQSIGGERGVLIAVSSATGGFARRNLFPGLPFRALPCAAGFPRHDHDWRLGDPLRPGPCGTWRRAGLGTPGAQLAFGNHPRLGSLDERQRHSRHVASCVSQRDFNHGAGRAGNTIGVDDCRRHRELRGSGVGVAGAKAHKRDACATTVAQASRALAPVRSDFAVSLRFASASPRARR